MVDVSLGLWAGTLGAILVMLSIDLFANRTAHVVSLREAAMWSSIWVACGVAFGIYLWIEFGSDIGAQYFAGYVIEKSLAVDNVFVWAVILSYFAVPREFQHRVLFLGIVLALVLRAGFIAVGAVLIANFQWILYVFGAFLVYTGIQMARHRNDHSDPSDSAVVRFMRRLIPVTDHYDGQHFFTKVNGVRAATPLMLVFVLIAVTDVIFAVDSIPAIFAVTQIPFIVFTSNAFAILGLRAMYFLLADLVHRFVYLKVGLSIVLVWVGVKMLLLDVVKVPTLVSLAIVIAVIAISIVASLRVTRGQAPHAPSVGHDASLAGDVVATFESEHSSGEDTEGHSRT